MAGIVLRKKILKASGLLVAFFDMSPHTCFHLGIILEPSNLPFKQLDRLLFDGVLISQAGQVDAFCRFG
jgi:hypothetical protein